MPGFDGTGPGGMGPLTGRGMGFCVLPQPSPAGVPYAPGALATPGAPLPAAWGFAPAWWRAGVWGFGRRGGRGRGFGRGFGRGWGRGGGRGRRWFGW
jgi:hypothetical protein